MGMALPGSCWQCLHAESCLGVLGLAARERPRRGRDSRKSLAAGELWHLDPEYEFLHCIDSWNVRKRPSLEAPVTRVIRLGERFEVSSIHGEWLWLRFSDCTTGWSRRNFGKTDALVPVRSASTRRLLVTPSDGSSGGETPQSARRHGASSEDSIRTLLAELLERRRALAAFSSARRARAAGDSVAYRRAQAASAVQETMAKLEIFGVDTEKVLGLEDAEDVKSAASNIGDLVVRLQSFKHSDFANPQAESCWLSTVFQSLWHSRVFHTVFERFIRPLPPSGPKTALGALQRTWELYELAATKREPVPVQALVAKWGRGYGDCAEAFGSLQQESAFQLTADIFALVPVPYTGKTPTRCSLWKLVTEMCVGAAPLIAVDFSLPTLSRVSIQRLTLAVAPASGVEASDMGEEHRLVAMICFMEEFKHYVVFCRRISNENSWLFFNDLPGLARGALRELTDWGCVAHECAYFGLCPKMLLYESSAAAQRAVERAARDKCGSSKL